VDARLRIEGFEYEVERGREAELLEGAVERPAEAPVEAPDRFEQRQFGRTRRLSFGFRLGSWLVPLSDGAFLIPLHAFFYRVTLTSMHAANIRGPVVRELTPGGGARGARRS
jgi:hypothetical protein